MFISVYLRTGIILEILLSLTLHLIFYRKITLKCDFSCTSQNNSLPLHREPAPGDVCTSSAEGSRHNKGVKYALCLAFRNLVNSQVSNTLQHFDVLGICILNHHTCQEGARVCVHIGVGFGVACSDTKAIPEPQIAEQQQCSPAFCLCIKSGAVV